MVKGGVSEHHNLTRKWAKDTNRYFTEENTQEKNNLMKRCSLSVSIGKMHMEITMNITIHLSEQLE